MKKLDIYRDNQNKGLWRDEGNVESIENAKVLVVGLGDIGGEFASAMQKTRRVLHRNTPQQSCKTGFCE